MLGASTVSNRAISELLPFKMGICIEELGKMESDKEWGHRFEEMEIDIRVIGKMIRCILRVHCNHMMVKLYTKEIGMRTREVMDMVDRNIGMGQFVRGNGWMINYRVKASVLIKKARRC